eukprot:2305491-Prorocentrum_lima.AAC.1
MTSSLVGSEMCIRDRPMRFCKRLPRHCICHMGPSCSVALRWDMMLVELHGSSPARWILDI